MKWVKPRWMHRAGKMGFTEKMLETVYIDRSEEQPDVDAQLEGNPDTSDPVADSIESVSTDGLILENPDVVLPDARPDDDDAVIVASEEESIGYEEIKEVLDHFIDQGADGTFSLKEDFLDKYAGDIPEQDFYSAFADKVKENEDAALFILLLPGCLIGIASGFHMAYTSANTDRPADRKTPGFFRHPSKKNKPKKPRKNGKELNRKIHKQEGESFSEFRCHETSQDHGEAVSKAMGSQDDSLQLHCQQHPEIKEQAALPFQRAAWFYIPISCW